jgi:hypothetical protein
MTLSKYNEVMENVKISKDMRDRILSGVEKELEKDAGSESQVVEVTDKKRISKIVEFRRYAGVAAAFVILFVGAAAVLKIRNADMSTSSEMMVEEASMVNHDTHKEVAAGTTQAMTEAEATEAAEPTDAEATTEAEAIEAETHALTNGKAASIERKEFSSLLKLNAETGVTFKEIQYLDSFSSSKDYYLYDGKIGVISYDVEGNTVTVRQMSTEFGKSIPDKYIESVIERQNSKAITAGGKSVTISGKDELYTVAEWSEYNLVFQLESTEALTLQDMQELMDSVLE